MSEKLSLFKDVFIIVVPNVDCGKTMLSPRFMAKPPLSDRGSIYAVLRVMR